MDSSAPQRRVLRLVLLALVAHGTLALILSAPTPSPSAEPQGALAVGAVAAAPPVVAEGAASAEESLRLVRDVLAGEAPRLGVDAREAVAASLVEAVAEHRLDPLLVLALIAQESRFDPAAVGPRGSLGLMQVRPFVGEDLAARHGLPWSGPETLLDPASNVRIGVGYLAELVRMFDDDDRALAAYNLGPYRYKRLLGEGRAGRVRYVERVRGHYASFARRYTPVELAAAGG